MPFPTPTDAATTEAPPAAAGPAPTMIRNGAPPVHAAGVHAPTYPTHHSVPTTYPMYPMPPTYPPMLAGAASHAPPHPLRPSVCDEYLSALFHPALFHPPAQHAPPLQEPAPKPAQKPLRKPRLVATTANGPVLVHVAGATTGGVEQQVARAKASKTPARKKGGGKRAASVTPSSAAGKPASGKAGKRKALSSVNDAAAVAVASNTAEKKPTKKRARKAAPAKKGAANAKQPAKKRANKKAAGSNAVVTSKKATASKASSKKATSSNASSSKATDGGTVEPVADQTRVDAALAAVMAAYGCGREAKKKLSAAQLRGVTAKTSGKWQAQVFHEGKSRYIGVFPTKESAALAYEAAVEVLKADRDDDGAKKTAKETERSLQLARTAARTVAAALGIE